MLEAALHLLFVRTFYKFIHLKKVACICPAYFFHVFVSVPEINHVKSVSMKRASIACYRNEIIIGQYDICTLFS